MHFALQRLAQRVRELFRAGRASIVDDTGPQQLIQLQIFVGGDADLEQVIDQVARLGEYGLASCPPTGAEVLAIFPNGNRSSGVIIATGHKASRLKGLLSGESALYNGLTGAWWKMAAAGGAHLNADATVDGTLEAASLVAGDGADGTFTTPLGQTVTVAGGIITNID